MRRSMVASCSKRCKALQRLARSLWRAAQGGHASQAAQGVQTGTDHAAMHAAMHKVPNELGLHVDAGTHPVSRQCG
jgi:hypothetical protein